MSRPNSKSKTSSSAAKVQGSMIPSRAATTRTSTTNSICTKASNSSERDCPRRVTRSQRLHEKKSQSSSSPSKDQSSDTSTISYQSSGVLSNERKRAAVTVVVTDEKAKPTSSKRGRLTNKARHYSLRSSDVSLQKETRLLSVSRTDCSNPTRLSVTVTPAEAYLPKHLKESRKRLPFTECKTSRSNIPEDVVDIYSKPKDQILDGHFRCRCPRNDCQMRSYNELATELSCCYMNDYGLEFVELLRKQETKEVLELTGMVKRQSLSSLSENSPLHVDDDSADSDVPDSTSDEDDDGEDTSTPGTPRPGTVLKYSLRGMSKSSSSSGHGEDPLPRQPYITTKMRNILVNWLGEAALEYKVSDESFHLSVSILDAVLSKGPPPKSPTRYNQVEDDSDSDSDFEDSDKENDEFRPFIIHRSDFQALGCACLWIAAKLDDKNPPGQEDFVYISDYSFKAEKLLALEAKVCKVLGFRFQRVTPVHFFTLFLKASQACCAGSYCVHENGILRLMCMYLAELSRVSVDLIATKPSLIAAAIVYLARVTIGIREKNPNHKTDENGYWTKTLVHFTGYSADELKETVMSIHKNHQQAEKAEHLNAPFTKYKKTMYSSVSLKTVPSVESLGFAVSP